LLAFAVFTQAFCSAVNLVAEKEDTDTRARAITIKDFMMSPI
jgi:hypothetical protein